MKNPGLKLIFGIIIFAFSVALAYFSADYLENQKMMEYWDALLMFGGIYVLVGVVVARIFPVSLGFLFAADTTILHVLSNEYPGYQNVSKVLIVGVIFVVLYIYAWMQMNDTPAAVSAPLPPSPPMH